MKLRVWWISQIPMKPFTREVDSVKEGVKLLETLALYDIFQLENNIKPDYSNVGGLEMFEHGEWVSWESRDGEDDPEVWLEDWSSNTDQNMYLRQDMPELFDDK